MQNPFTIHICTHTCDIHILLCIGACAHVIFTDGHIDIHVKTHQCVYIYACVYMFICICIYAHTYTHASIYTCRYITCIYTCICIYIMSLHCAYIHIYSLSPKISILDPPALAVRHDSGSAATPQYFSLVVQLAEPSHQHLGSARIGFPTRIRIRGRSSICVPCQSHGFLTQVCIHTIVGLTNTSSLVGNCWSPPAISDTDLDPWSLLSSLFDHIDVTGLVLQQNNLQAWPRSRVRRGTCWRTPPAISDGGRRLFVKINNCMDTDMCQKAKGLVQACGVNDSLNQIGSSCRFKHLWPGKLVQACRVKYVLNQLG